MSATLAGILGTEVTSAALALFSILLAVRFSRSPVSRAAGIRAGVRMVIYGNIGASISAVASRNWTELAVYLTCIALAAAWLWRRRKKRRPAAKLLGAKARAIRDGMVRKVRESGKARPALRPVPVPS